MKNTTDVSEWKRQEDDLICEWHVRIEDEAKITSIRADWDDIIVN